MKIVNAEGLQGLNQNGATQQNADTHFKQADNVSLWHAAEMHNVDTAKFEESKCFQQAQHDKKASTRATFCDIRD